MIRCFVALVGAYGFIYGELGAPDLWHGLFLPGVFVLCVMYLFWFKGFVAIAIGLAAYQMTEIEGQSVLRSIIAPLIVAICIIYLAWWARMRLPGGDAGISGGDLGDGGDG